MKDFVNKKKQSSGDMGVGIYTNPEKYSDGNNNSEQTIGNGKCKAVVFHLFQNIAGR